MKSGAFYVLTCIGLAFGTSAFLVLAQLLSLGSLSAVLGGIVLAGCFCLILSSSLSELAATYPGAPGIRTYLKVAFPGWLSLSLIFAYLFAAQLVAGIETYLCALVISPDSSARSLYISLVLITSVAVVVNVLGIELSRRLQAVITTFLIFALTAFASVCLIQNPISIRAIVLTSASVTLAQVVHATGIAVYLFVGFEWVTMIGSSPAHYRWKIPLAMPAAITALMLLYLLLSLVLSAGLSGAELTNNSAPQVLLLHRSLGSSGVRLARTISLAALVACTNAGLMGGARLLYVMGREGSLPSLCTRLTSKGVPYLSIVLLGVSSLVTSVLLSYLKVQALAIAVSSGLVCFVYSGYMVALIVLRRRSTGRPTSFRSPVPQWLQAASAACLPVIGVGALVSEATLRRQALIGTVVIVASSVCLATISLDRIRRRSLERAHRVHAVGSSPEGLI